MKALLLIYSCKKYSFMYKEYIEKYYKLGYDIFYVYADPNLDEEYTIDLQKNIITLKCNDNFENLPEKTYSLFKCLLKDEEFQNYDYFIKMDDDTELSINYETFINLDILKKNHDYIGVKKIKSEACEHNYHFGKCDNNNLNNQSFILESPMIWGAGFFYILSKNGIKLICQEIETYNLLKEYLYEDMLIGKIFYENDIEFIEGFQNFVITDLHRPRKTSISSIIQQTYSSNLSKTISKIKKVSFNKTQINNNIAYEDNEIDNEIEKKIKQEVLINTELNKKIFELNNKISDNNTNDIIIGNTFNPIIHRNTKKITGKKLIKIK